VRTFGVSVGAGTLSGGEVTVLGGVGALVAGVARMGSPAQGNGGNPVWETGIATRALYLFTCLPGRVPRQDDPAPQPLPPLRVRPWPLVIETTRIDSEDSSRLQIRSRHFAPFPECVGSSFLSQPPSELSRQQGQRFADRAGHSSSPIPPGQG
jgi:hypothetical protein